MQRLDDKSKSNVLGSSNVGSMKEGNTVRQVFKNPELLTKVIDIDASLIKKFKLC